MKTKLISVVTALILALPAAAQDAADQHRYWEEAVQLEEQGKLPKPKAGECVFENCAEDTVSISSWLFLLVMF